MQLETLRFELIDATWNATSPLVSWWGDGAGCYESLALHRRSADLLRVLVYHVRITEGAQNNLGTVHRLLTQEYLAPSSILGTLLKSSKDEVRKTLVGLAEARGSLFGDAVPDLLLNLEGPYLHTISGRWPLR